MTLTTERKRALRAKGPQVGDVVLAVSGKAPAPLSFIDAGRVDKRVRAHPDSQGRWRVKRTDGMTGRKEVYVVFVAASDAATVWKEVADVG